MLHFRPELVKMELAENFRSITQDMEGEYRHLKPDGTHDLAWIAHDLNSFGVMGEAARATAEKGKKTCMYQVAGFIELLREIERYPLSNLYSNAL